VYLRKFDDSPRKAGDRVLAGGQSHLPTPCGAGLAPIDPCGEGIAAATQGERPAVVSGERTLRLMLATTPGRKATCALQGYGKNEFVPWQLER
jgi:hypothetical protein